MSFIKLLQDKGISFRQLLLAKGQFHHYASIVFVSIFLLILWFYPPWAFYELVSVFKKKSGEEVTYLPLKNVRRIHFPDFKGYMNWETSANCHVMPHGEKDSRILLHNLQGHCDASSVVNRAWGEQYEAVIFYNHSDANLLATFDEKLPVILVEDAIAGEMIKYSFPKTVRFQVKLKQYEDLRWIYRSIIFIPLRVIVYKDLYFNTLSVFVYLLLIFATWRHFLVPAKYGLVRRAKKAVEKIRILTFPKSYEVLVTLPQHPYWIVQIFYFVFYPNTRNKSKTLDLDKLEHDPLTPRVEAEDFEYINVLGSGRFETVTKVTFVRSGRKLKTFAMKSILRSSNSFSLLETEILACGNICEGIVPMWYGFVSSQKIHIVMELMQGTLADLRDEITIHHAKIYTVELAMAIEFLHCLGIAHRHVRPSNIMFDLNYHLKLGDFGIARRISKRDILTEEHTSAAKETKFYWAPENYQNQWSLASDWWAFGCVVYQMFSMVDWLFFMKNYHSNRGGPLGTIRGVEDEEVGTLLMGCFKKSPILRHPLTDGRGNPINISDLDQFMEIPIPINRSVSLPEHFLLRSGHRYLGFENVEERNPGAYNNESVKYYLPFGDFYFDKNDMECYNRNTLTLD